MSDMGFLTQFGIGASYIKLTLSDFHNKEVAGVVKKYIDRFSEHRKIGSGLLFCGPTGSGKTMLMSLVLKNLIMKNFISGVILNLDEATELLSSSWESDVKKAIRDKKLFGNPILAIDNIPVMMNKSRQPKDILAHILRHRNEAGKVTLLATSLPESQIANTLGEEVFGLISEATTTIFLPNVNYRSVVNMAQKKKLFEN